MSFLSALVRVELPWHTMDVEHERYVMVLLTLYREGAHRFIEYQPPSE